MIVATHGIYFPTQASHLYGTTLPLRERSWVSLLEISLADSLAPTSCTKPKADHLMQPQRRFIFIIKSYSDIFMEPAFEVNNI